MRKAVVAATVAGALLVPAGSSATVTGPQDQCFAVNPGRPTCSFTSSENTSGPVSGAAGNGDWVVTIKRGKKKLTYKPSGTQPQAVGFLFMKGDKVTATVNSMGGGVLVGGD